MRRRAPMVLVALGVALLLGWYLAYTQRLVRQLRHSAEREGRIYARTYRTLSDPNAGPDRFLSVLFETMEQERSSGIPLVITDTAGNPTDAANLDFVERPPGERTRALVPKLDAQNAPFVEPGLGALHYGDSPLVRGLRIIPALQAGAIAMLVGVGLYALLVRARADREHVWAGMARESAHQLGTPLMSLSGWIALLDDEVTEQGARADPMLRSAVGNMRSDLERLERVAHRFERIGRPPRREPVDVGSLVERIATYFRARVPKGSHAVAINVHVPADSITIEGDAVLLEWVLEALTKNAIDALAGRGGRIDLSAVPLDGGGARLRVADDGPGVPRELRGRIFDAGYSTKERGWGIGLSLARRIVQENHGGRLVLASTDRGAAFDVMLR
ncbi:MAG: HAMP domain-containing histidine kinase [Gemmatirosa sp.]|nr:HAMP domain-containing histidine kinase [Gemmatirosa sp.]